MNEDPPNQPIDGKGWLIGAGIVLGIIGLGLWTCAATAIAHEATTTNGQPLGWNWDPICCGGNDCAIIPDSAVVEGPDGYHVTLRAGEHPMLKSKGYSAIIPYGSEKTSPTGEYGICLSPEGSFRFCFYSGGKGY